jgi:Ca2+-binding EF-hand superfamily protein
LRPDSQTPYRPEETDPNIAAEKIFKSFDTDQSGFLSGPEISDKLLEVADRVDANRDGRIDVNEYKGFLAQRVQQEAMDLRDKEREKELGKESKREKAEAKSDSKSGKDAGRGAENKAESELLVIRAGKLPTGLPSWFEKLDLDGDGQVGLYEWRHAGMNTEEFEKMDLNADGLLPAGELLRYARILGIDVKKVEARPLVVVKDTSGKNLPKNRR